MRRLVAHVVAVFCFVLLPRLAAAQELKTINKPGVMLANVSSEDENKKPLKIKKGEKVTVIYSRDDWMWVKTKGGRGGWVLKKEVKVDDAAAAAAPEKKEDGKKAAADDAKKKKEEEAQAKKAAAEDKKAAADAAKKKKEEEAQAKKAAAEEKKADARRKKEEEAAAKKAAAEEAKRKKEEEALAKKGVTAQPAPVAQPGPAAQPEPAPAPTPVMPQPEAVVAPQPAVQPQPQPEPAPQQVAMITPPAQPVAAAAPVAMAAGFLTIVASEPGAAIILDGRRVGDAPMRRLQVEGGRHQVTIMKDDFTPATQDIDVNGNEAAISLALSPSPEAVSRHKMGVFRNWGIGFGALGVGAVAAVLSGIVGLAGAGLWVASATAVAWAQANAVARLNDPVAKGMAEMVKANSTVGLLLTVTGAGLAFAGPLLALVFGVTGSVAAAALFMTAGDPGRYSSYE